MSSGDFLHRVKPGWSRTLLEILERAGSLGPRALLVFDLDSTVFDNRPRQARILREYGQASGVAPLAGCTASHWSSGWDMRGAMLRCGLSAQQADEHLPLARLFWGERFFTSAYCVDDVAIDGAPGYLDAVVDRGATLAYVTGRPEPMREGTLEAMRRTRMPLPGGQVQLLMKPEASADDDAFKRGVHQRLSSMGELIAFFDNEPMHLNDYARSFPSAVPVHLATDHSGRTLELVEHSVSVPSFVLR